MALTTSCSVMQTIGNSSLFSIQESDFVFFYKLKKKKIYFPFYLLIKEKRTNKKEAPTNIKAALLSTFPFFDMKNQNKSCCSTPLFLFFPTFFPSWQKVEANYYLPIQHILKTISCSEHYLRIASISV